MLTASTTISTILDAVTSFVTAAIGWITSFANEIVATPLLLVFVIASFVFLAVHLIRRIIRL